MDDWFAGFRPAESGESGHPAGGPPMDPNDVYFGYILNNIRSGDS